MKIKTGKELKMPLILILLFAICVNAISAFIKFERFSNKEGFNQNTINAIEEDKYGFLWFGTPNGLIRYDGYDFKSYKYSPSAEQSISHNYITSIHTDSMGILWVGTRDGVNVYIPWLEKFVSVPIDKSIRVSHINSDSKGRVWVCGRNEVFVCKAAKVNGSISFSVSSNLITSDGKISDINEIYFDERSQMFLSAYSGLWRVDYSTEGEDSLPSIKKMISIDSFSNQYINTIREINGIYWVGTDEGLYKSSMEGDRMHIIRKFKFLNEEDEFNENLSISNVFEDHSGDIWVCTLNKGLLRYVPEKESFVKFSFDAKNEESLSNNRINCILQDQYNVLWIGTAQGGISKLDLMQKAFMGYRHNPYDKFSISGNLVTSILEDSRGFLWVSAYGRGISRSQEPVNDENISNLKFENLKARIHLPSKEIILSIYEDRKGYIWIGTNQELVVYNPFVDSFKKVILEKDKKRVNLYQIRVIHQIDENQILIGGNRSVLVSNPWEKIKQDVRLTAEEIGFKNYGIMQCFLIDNRGNYWFGTTTGVYQGIHKDGRLLVSKLSVNQKQGTTLVNNNIFSLMEDELGNIWVGTFGKGLRKIYIDEYGESYLMDQFTENDLLPDDAVYGILQEDKNHLWLSTDMGLGRINTNKKKSIVYDVRDGLAHNNFRQASYFKSKLGYFYFGGLNGLTVFKPSEIKQNEILPQVLITALSVNNKEIKAGENTKGYLS
ncbi:ligand-binding sensor domain-containing protein [Saccharicrinis sp. 156]|uniref:ligand-binding sensor domain-containing protein n=1 Tax=Saccharicrinis sp. 156 TaxID=3417574 RepID=UPI003D349D68